MVFKLLIVMLALLVLDTSAQQNRIQLEDWYPYTYGSYKDSDKRFDPALDVQRVPTMQDCVGSKCNPDGGQLNGNTVREQKRENINRSWDRIALMNILHSLPRDERPVILIPKEYDNKLEK